MIQTGEKRSSGLGLDHPQLPARFFRHALWGPHRLVDDVDVGFSDAGNLQKAVAYVRDYIGRHRPSPGSEGHLDFDLLQLEIHGVKEAEAEFLDWVLGGST